MATVQLVVIQLILISLHAIIYSYGILYLPVSSLLIPAVMEYALFMDYFLVISKAGNLIHAPLNWRNSFWIQLASGVLFVIAISVVLGIASWLKEYPGFLLVLGINMLIYGKLFKTIQFREKGIVMGRRILGFKLLPWNEITEYRTQTDSLGEKTLCFFTKKTGLKKFECAIHKDGEMVVLSFLKASSLRPTAGPDSNQTQN